MAENERLGPPMNPEAGLALYAAIESDVAELPKAMRTRIDRESRPWLEALHPGLPGILRNTLLVTSAAFASVKRLCYDRTNGERPSGEFSTAVFPLARTFLDAMITVAFVRDEPRKHVERYYVGGLCTELARYNRLVLEYGADCEWGPHLASLKAWIDWHEQGNPDHRVMLSDEEKANPRKHARELWPGPGRLIQKCSESRRDHLLFMQDWFYDELSQDAHMSYMGIARRVGPLHEQTLSAQADEFRYRTFYDTLTLYLALLAEIADAANLRVERGRIARVWKHLDGIPGADQLWKRRYRALLTGEMNG